MSPWYTLPWLSQAWQPIIGTEVQEPSSAYLQCSVIAPGKGSHVTDMMPEPANLGWAIFVAAEKLTSAWVAGPGDGCRDRASHDASAQ